MPIIDLTNIVWENVTITDIEDFYSAEPIQIFEITDPIHFDSIDEEFGLHSAPIP